MAQQVTITYYGFAGTGRNMTEAKKDAGRKIDRAMEGTYTPEILSHRGHAVMLTREPLSGWGWCRIMDPIGGLQAGNRHTYCYGDNSYEACKRSALENLAQLGWQVGDDAIPPEFLTDRSSQTDFRHWAEFQTRYAAAAAHGMNSYDAHSYAGRNPGRPELWANELATSAA